jgi:hypothetical protein
MMILKLDLTSWIHLGLYRDFLRDLTDVQSIALFNLPKNMVLQCVLEKSSDQYEKEVVSGPVPGQLFKGVIPMQQVGSHVKNHA